MSRDLMYMEYLENRRKCPSCRTEMRQERAGGFTDKDLFYCSSCHKNVEVSSVPQDWMWGARVAKWAIKIFG